MRRALALAAAAVACTVAPAHAASPAYAGGCGFDSGSVEVVAAGHHVGDRTRYRGVVYAAVVLYDEDSGTPLSGTVQCVLKVDGVVTQATTPVHGTGLVVTAEPLDFTAPGGLWSTELCEEITFDGGGTVEGCGVVTGSQIPPQELWDAVDAVTQGVLTPVLAPLVCPLTGDSAVNRELAGAWFGSTGYVYGFPC